MFTSLEGLDFTGFEKARVEGLEFILKRARGSLKGRPKPAVSWKAIEKAEKALKSSKGALDTTLSGKIKVTLGDLKSSTRRLGGFYDAIDGRLVSLGAILDGAKYLPPDDKGREEVRSMNVKEFKRDLGSGKSLAGDCRKEFAAIGSATKKAIRQKNDIDGLIKQVEGEIRGVKDKKDKATLKGKLKNLANLVDAYVEARKTVVGSFHSWRNILKNFS